MRNKTKSFARIIALLSVLILTISIIPQSIFAKAYDPEESFKDLEIRFWEDEQPDIGFYINAASRYTLETVQEPSIGTSSGEWSVMNLLRGMYTGYDYMNHTPDRYFEDYIGRVEQEVKEKEGNLNRNKISEWSRLFLTLTPLSYDVKDVAGYDFIEKHSESHSFTHRQGINGSIWSIIALNTGKYELYEDSDNEDVNTIAKLIDNILDKEITQEDGTVGGWALWGNEVDPDITGMALQAFAPYYLDEELYHETDASASYEEFSKAVERAIYASSEVQMKNGAFAAFGNINVESTVQIIVALTALGIDPLQENIHLPQIDKDISFVTEGADQDGVITNNMIDAIITFWANGSGSAPEVGGFKHVTTGSDGGGGAGHDVNGMATDQALYGLIAYDRFLQGENSLYDMTDMMNDEYKTMEAKSYNLTYDHQTGGESNKESYSPYESINISEGEDSNGRTFVNWNTKEDGSGTTYEPEDLLSMPEQDITLYAQYEYQDYKITYETNGGTLTDDKIVRTYTIEDSDISLPTFDQLENENFTFDGWYVEKDFAGDPVKEIPQGSHGDQTFYAKWIKDNETEDDTEEKPEEDESENDVDEYPSDEDESASVKEVTSQINNLPKKDTVTLKDDEKVIQARNAFDGLTTEKQQKIKNVNQLELLETRLSELKEEAINQKAIEFIESIIKDLPDASNMTLESSEAIEEARLSFKSLTVTQQDAVSNIEKLNELESQVEKLQKNVDQEKAQEVADLIEELPLVEELTLENKDQVEEIRKSFYQLTVSQQDLLNDLGSTNNTEAFKTIESEMFDLRELDEDERNTDIVEAMIAGFDGEDKESVEKVNKAFSQLTETQQSSIENTQKLKDATSKIAELEKEKSNRAEAEKVYVTIYSLPNIKEVTIGHDEHIDKARKLLNNLSDDQNSLVSNTNELVSLEDKVNELKANNDTKRSALKVDFMIQDLPNNVTLKDEESIHEAREAFDDLTEAEQNLVINLDELEKREEKINKLHAIDEEETEDKDSAQEVEGMIESLPSLDKVTLKDEGLIKEARKAYENLTKDEKKDITNLDKLKNLEERISKLKATDEEKSNDKESAQKVEDMIQNLPKLDKVTLNDEKSISEARKAYEDLTKNQQDLVANHNDLEDIEKKLKELGSTNENPDSNKEKEPVVPNQSTEDGNQIDESEKEMNHITSHTDKQKTKSEKENTDELPKTSTNTFNAILIGFILVILGGTLYFIRRKKTAK